MSTITRISTQQQYDSLLDAMKANRKNVDNASTEIATGFKTDVFAESPGLAGVSLELRASKALVDTYLASNQLTAQKMDMAATLMSSARGEAQTVQEALLASLASTADPETLRSTANSALQGIIGAMNSTYGGEYIFSGTRSDVAPFASDGAGGYVYQGSTTNDLNTRISDSKTITVAPRADDEAMLETIAVLSAISNADFDAMSSDDYIAFANDLISRLGKGLDGIVSMEARHGGNQATMKATILNQDTLSAKYNNTIVDIEGVDPEDAAIRLQEARDRLDQTYAVTAKISGLSLLSYI